MIIQAYQDLTYRAVIRRQDGDDWPPLVHGALRYHVSELAIDVGMHDGTLHTRAPEVRAAQRIKADGTLGVTTLSPGHLYHGDQHVNRLADALRHAALQAAAAAHAEILSEPPPGPAAQA